jgi:hypothetical protein
MKNLIYGKVDIILPVRSRKDEPNRAGPVLELAAPQITLADPAKQPMKLINAGDGSGRIVDRRRKGFKGYINDDPENKFRVLLGRSLNTQNQTLTQLMVAQALSTLVKVEKWITVVK